MRRLPVLLLCVAVGGCALAPPGGPAGRPFPPPAPDAGSAEAPAGERSDSPDRAGDRQDAGAGGERGGSSDASGSAAPASAALLERSRGQRAAGDLAAAASSIERALRIEPNNAALWVELGEIKLDEGMPAQAENMARKALSLAAGDALLTDRAERLLAAAACADGGC